MSVRFDITLRKSAGAMCFQTGNIRIETDFLRINGSVPDVRFVSRYKTECRFGGLNGTSVTDVFENGSWRICRDLWTDGEKVLWRYRLTNRTDQPADIESLRPFHAEGADAVYLNGIRAGQWQAYLDQDDGMDGIPSAVRIGELDNDYVMSRIGAIWDTQDVKKEFDANPLSLKFQPYGILHAGDGVPEILLGFLTGDSMLLKMGLATDEARENLSSLSGDCLLNCCIMPGEERATEYFTLFADTDTTSLIRTFWDWAGTYYNIPETPKARPYAVGCTWHYYGGAVNEQIVLDNLAAIREKQIPLDVYMIDDFWEPCYGNWTAKPDVFPHGMKWIAEKIRQAGLKPGIWTAPFAVSKKAPLAQEHPEWLMRNAAGEPVTYFNNFVLDLTFPGALKYVEDLFRRLHDDYGFLYFKIDFTRCEFAAEGGICHDRSKTTLEAYRAGVAAIRRAIGDESFLCVCGGHYCASVGLADTQRNSGDTYGKWGYKDKSGGFVPTEEYRVKQTVGRLPLRRLWHTNADGMIVRLQEKSVTEQDFGLSVGILNDDEAMMSSVVHYFNGGILMCGESLVQIGGDRLALYRHVIPSANAQSFAADPLRKWHPSQIVTHIKPVCAALASWNTVSVINLSSEPLKPQIVLNERILDSLPGDTFLLYENITGKFLGTAHRGECVSPEELPPHSARVFKVIPAEKDGIYLLGTDLHHSGGGVEIASWECSGDSVRGIVETPWKQYPVRLAAAKLSGGTVSVKNTVLGPGKKEFSFNF